MTSHFVSPTCKGEACGMCGAAATHKLAEDQNGVHSAECLVTLRPSADNCACGLDYAFMRHQLTQYACCACFTLVVGAASPCLLVDMPLMVGHIDAWRLRFSHIVAQKRTAETVRNGVDSIRAALESLESVTACVGCRRTTSRVDGAIGHALDCPINAGGVTYPPFPPESVTKK